MRPADAPARPRPRAISRPLRFAAAVATGVALLAGALTAVDGALPVDDPVAVHAAGPGASGGRDADCSGRPGSTAEALDAYRDTNHTPGVAAAVIRDGAVTFEASGVDGRGDAVDEHTPFRVASMSKSFTAALVMRLVERGRVDLDAPVHVLLPTFGMADPRASAITLRMLLTHTSGITPFTSDAYAVPPPASLDEVLQQLRHDALTTDPGTVAEYDNRNYTLAAGIVERLEGRPFAEVLRDSLFAPLGMTGTVSTTGCADRVDGLATAFARLPLGATPMPEVPGMCLGSGGVVSTAADLARWLDVFVGGGTTTDGVRVLAPESVAAMRGAASGAGFGFGWRTEQTQGVDVVRHGGALVTWASGMGFGLGADGAPNGTAAVVLANAPGPALDLAVGLVAAASGAGAPVVAGDTQWPLQLGFTLAVLGAVAFGVAGALGAPRWARRSARRPGRARRLIGVAWPLALAAAGATLPPTIIAVLVSGVFSMTSGWAYVTAMFPALAAACVLLTASGIVVAVARAVRAGAVPSGATGAGGHRHASPWRT